MAGRRGGQALSDRERKFCDEYRIDLCIKQAAIRAGYSPISAGGAGQRLMKKPAVRARIEEMMAEDSRRTGINVDRILRELARVGFVDPARVIDPETGAVPVGLTEDDRAAIQSVRVKVLPSSVEGAEPGVEREVRLYDKLKALEHLGKHIGMYGVGDKLKLEQARLELERERLEIMRMRSGSAEADERELGVVLMPEAAGNVGAADEGKE